MLKTLLINIILIFIQFILSVALYVPFYKFYENIYAKEKPRFFRIADVITEERMMAKFILLSGLSILVIAIIINLFNIRLIGFYLSSVLFISIGFGSVYYPKGRRISEACWVTRCQKDNFIVTLGDHKALVTGERLRGKPSQVIYAENSPKWLPPHDIEEVSEKDYEYMLKAILKFLKNNGVIQRPGEDMGHSVTKEGMISRFEKKGWKVEKSANGSTRVSPPKFNNRNKGNK